MSILKCVLVLSVLLGTAPSAKAATPCAVHSDLVQVLEQRYHEKLSAYGLDAQKDKVEVYVSKEGTFSILATRADGLSCILSVGGDWELELKNLTAL